MKYLFFLILTTLIASCTSSQKSVNKASVLSLTPYNFSALKNWRNVDKESSFLAFKKSCKQIEKRAYKTTIIHSPYFGTANDWKEICDKHALYTLNDADQFFETFFSPVKVNDNSSKFTGYYEPILYGSYIRGGQYQYPLYAPPKNLSKPYPSRSKIVSGALTGKASPLIWVTSEIDSFFLHIQGSGRIILPDGGTVKVAYADQNGHKYFAIGKYLIEEGHIPKNKMSAEAIKNWLRNNPTQAQSVMNKNPSYVFFKLNQNNSNEYAKGAAGVPLTPEYSLAVDRKIYPYGLPMWIETAVKVPPVHNMIPSYDKMAFHRLMVAQDTGGAIKGSVRGDIFFGTGQHAEYMASHLSEAGNKYILLPKKAVARNL